MIRTVTATVRIGAVRRGHMVEMVIRAIKLAQQPPNHSDEEAQALKLEVVRWAAGYDDVFWQLPCGEIAQLAIETLGLLSCQVLEGDDDGTTLVLEQQDTDGFQRLVDAVLAEATRQLETRLNPSPATYGDPIAALTRKQRLMDSLRADGVKLRP